MKKELLNKLKNYSKAAAAIAAIGSTASAQVVYTDITPDVVLSAAGDSYQIDFDGDGVNDVLLVVASGTTAYGWKYNFLGADAASGGTGTEIVCSGYVAALSTTDVISSGANFTGSAPYGGTFGMAFNWSNTGYGALTYSGNWQNVTDKYLGVKFDISGATHYGWIRADVAVADFATISGTIKDYAYDATADVAITAGDMGNVGVEKISLNTKIFPNPVSDVLNIELGEVANYTVKLATLDGKEVLVKNINGKTLQLNVSNLETASYILTIDNGTAMTTKNIVVK